MNTDVKELFEEMDKIRYIIPFTIYNKKFTKYDQAVYRVYAKLTYYLQRFVTTKEIKHQLDVERELHPKGKLKKFTLKEIEKCLKHLTDEGMIYDNEANGELFDKTDFI